MKNLLLSFLFLICGLAFTSNTFAQTFPKAVKPQSSVPVCISEERERGNVPDYLTCNGESYCFKDQSYSGICGRVFCKASLCSDAQLCKDDNDAKTIACYNKMVAASDAKLKFTQGGEIPAGNSK